MRELKNKYAIMLLAILAVSAFSFLAGVYATPLASITTASPAATTSPTPTASPTPTLSPIPPITITQTYVRVDGIITMYGTKNAMGSIQAQSRTTTKNSDPTVQYSSSTAIWTTNLTRPLAAVRTKENFTYSFYTARLVKGNFTALDFKGNSFYMNGTWNVWSITETFTVITDKSGNILSIDSNQHLVPLATKAYGELIVPSGWSTFTLSITGVNAVSGKVIAEVTTTRMFNPFIIASGSTSTTVTRTDLDSIVKAYGSMPGWGNYDVRMDYCLHYKIDICDLATAAANLNTA